MSTMTDKIRALLAKGSSTDNEHEAEVFLAKARELMEEHSITDADLAVVENPLSRTQIRIPYSAGWYRHVAARAAGYLGGSTVFHRERYTGTVSVEFLGRQDRLETCLVMVPYLWERVVRTGNDLGRERHGRGATPAQKRRCIAEVGVALAARLLRMTAQSPARPSAPGLPVPVSEADALRDQLFPDLRQSRENTIVPDVDSIQAAQGISIDLQMTGRQSAAGRLR